MYVEEDYPQHEQTQEREHVPQLGTLFSLALLQPAHLDLLPDGLDLEGTRRVLLATPDWASLDPTTKPSKKKKQPSPLVKLAKPSFTSFTRRRPRSPPAELAELAPLPPPSHSFLRGSSVYEEHAPIAASSAVSLPRSTPPKLVSPSISEASTAAQRTRSSLSVPTHSDALPKFEHQQTLPTSSTALASSRACPRRESSLPSGPRWSRPRSASHSPAPNSLSSISQSSRHPADCAPSVSQRPTALSLGNGSLTWEHEMSLEQAPTGRNSSDMDISELEQMKQPITQESAGDEILDFDSFSLEDKSTPSGDPPPLPLTFLPTDTLELAEKPNQPDAPTYSSAPSHTLEQHQPRPARPFPNPYLAALAQDMQLSLPPSPVWSASIETHPQHLHLVPDSPRSQVDPLSSTPSSSHIVSEHMGLGCKSLSLQQALARVERELSLRRARPEVGLSEFDWADDEPFDPDSMVDEDEEEEPTAAGEGSFGAAIATFRSLTAIGEMPSSSGSSAQTSFQLGSSGEVVETAFAERREGNKVLSLRLSCTFLFYMLVISGLTPAF
ncbi:hypothetical protein JCM11641_006374 [Rhodosporidiobolus odoratus]